MKIKKLILRTIYLQTLKEFYSSVLQLNVYMSEEKLHIQFGETEVVFIPAESGEPFYHFAINIPSNKIEEARGWLNDKVKLLWLKEYHSDIADFVNWHAKSIYFFDPAGNILELIARFDLDNATSEVFSSRQFLSVSEIGLVFKENEFEQKVDEIFKKYSLSNFSKQPPLPQFRALGDDEGLFIVVPENRNWYSTEKPSGIFPMTIYFENNGKTHEL